MNDSNKLALSYLISDEDPEHSFALQVLKHAGTQILFRSLDSRGVDTSSLIGIVARGMSSKVRSATGNSYSDRLSSSKSSAASLIKLLGEGQLFRSPAEQALAIVLLEQIVTLPNTKPPASALLRTGKEQNLRSLRLSIQQDLEMAGIKLNSTEFAELCSIADPDINFGTAQREFCAAVSRDSGQELLEHNAKMSIIYALYCKAIDP